MNVSVCELQCTDGYNMTQGGEIGMCAAVNGSSNAEYQGYDTTCDRSRCPAIALPSGVGKVVVSGCFDRADFGEQCVLGCEDGWVPTNFAVGECRPNHNSATASYQGHTLTCTRSTCDRPSLSPNQVVLGGCQSDGVQTVSTCSVGCADGYTASNDSIVGFCTADLNRTSARYTGQDVSCVASACPAPVLTTGQIITSGCAEGGNMGNDTCNISCANGYTLLRSTLGFCEADANSTSASYQNQSAICDPIPCFWHNEPLNNSGTWCFGSMGKVCAYGCEPGYQPNGDRTCSYSDALLPALGWAPHFQDCWDHGYGRDCHMGFMGGECSECAAGQSNNDRGRTHCLDCVPGKHAADDGMPLCLDCPAPFKNLSDGSYNNITGAIDCVPWTVCSVQHQHSTGEFEAVGPSTTNNRQCQYLTLCNYTAQYERVAPTNFSDRQCANFRVCIINEFESAPMSMITDRVCNETTVCDFDQWESVAATPTSDRNCTLLKVCNASEYETVAPVLENRTTINDTHVSDRQCALARVCGLEIEFETLALTPNADRQCSNLTVCNASEYQSVAQTATSDRECSALTVCFPHQFEGQPAKYDADRQCTNYSRCIIEDCHGGVEQLNASDAAACQFESRPITRTTDRICSDFTMCSTSQHQTVTPTLTSDRSCGDTTNCSNTSQYETVAPTRLSDRLCANLTICHVTTQYENDPPAHDKDRNCTDYRTCTAWEFEMWAPTYSTDRMCINLTVCSDHEYESIDETCCTNRACTRATVCSSLQHETVSLTESADRQCALTSRCNYELYFASVEPTPTSNRECTLLRVCSPLGSIKPEFEVAAPTPSSNRVCQEILTCKYDQYTSLAPTPSTDRGCIPLTTCRRDGCHRFNSTLSEIFLACEYEDVTPSEISDRHCTLASECSPLEYEIDPSSEFLDRVCQHVTMCSTDEYETVVPTATSDRRCTVLTVCGEGGLANTYEVAAPSLRDYGVSYCTCDGKVRPVNDPCCDALPELDGSWWAGSHQGSEVGEPTAIGNATLVTARWTQHVSDRRCQEYTACSASEFANITATPTSDRVCIPLTVCGGIEYESVISTATTDRECAKQRIECRDNEIELIAVTPTSDKVCVVKTEPTDGAVIMTITLLMDIAEVAADIDAFRAIFTAEVAKLAGIDPSRASVVRVFPGSVIVQFAVSPGESGSGPSVSDAIWALHVKLPEVAAAAATPTTAVADVWVGSWEEPEYIFLSRIDMNAGVQYESVVVGVESGLYVALLVLMVLHLLFGGVMAFFLIWPDRSVANPLMIAHAGTPSPACANPFTCICRLPSHLLSRRTHRSAAYGADDKDAVIGGPENSTNVEAITQPKCLDKCFRSRSCWCCCSPRRQRCQRGYATFLVVLGAANLLADALFVLICISLTVDPVIAGLRTAAGWALLLPRFVGAAAMYMVVKKYRARLVTEATADNAAAWELERRLKGDVPVKAKAQVKLRKQQAALVGRMRAAEAYPWCSTCAQLSAVLGDPDVLRLLHWPVSPGKRDRRLAGLLAMLLGLLANVPALCLQVAAPPRITFPLTASNRPARTDLSLPALTCQPTGRLSTGVVWAFGCGCLRPPAPHRPTHSTQLRWRPPRWC